MGSTGGPARSGRRTAPSGCARWLAALSVVALATAACGRNTSEPRSATSSTTRGAAGAGDFGTLEGVCGPGDPKGSTDRAVTPSSVTVGTFSDPGSSIRPGLNQELFDTAEVFAAWCNDHGGINGRRIVVDEHDSALFNVRPEMAKACEDDFFLVGGGAAFDQEGVKPRLECLLPAISGFAVSSEARGADLQVQPIPNGIRSQVLGPYDWLAEEFPAGASHAGILGAAIPGGQVTLAMRRELARAAGWKLVYDGTVPATGPPTWAPYVEGLRSKGVKGLVWVGEPENLAALESALRDANYHLDFVITDSNHYDQKLIDLGGAAVDNVYVVGALVPFEMADENPATREYLDLFEKYKPEGKARAYLGLQGMSAWLLFATSATKCGDDLTRRCVYDNARRVTGWTGGGLHAPQNPSEGLASKCFMLYRAGADGFTFPDVDPDDGPFNCDADNILMLKGDYGKPTTLADVGRSIDDLP